MEYSTPPVRPTMGFVEAIQVCFSKYADFNGRASRAEFWWFYLLGVIVSALVYVPHLCYVAYIASLAMIVPQLAVTWRRMHDIGKGGGWFFINFIPLIGTIWFIILAATKGEPGANRFGDAPYC